MLRSIRKKKPLKAWLALLVVAATVLLLAQAALTAPGDLVFPRDTAAVGGGGIAPAVFPHWLHRTRYRCDSCHLRLFEMQLGATEISMELIRNGQSCGTCHNGKQAFNVTFQSCSRCHASAEK